MPQYSNTEKQVLILDFGLYVKTWIKQSDFTKHEKQHEMLPYEITLVLLF